MVHRARISQNPVIIVNPVSPREVPENLVVPGVSGTLRMLKLLVSLGSLNSSGSPATTGSPGAPGDIGSPEPYWISETSVTRDFENLSSATLIGFREPRESMSSRAGTSDGVGIPGSTLTSEIQVTL